MVSDDHGMLPSVSAKLIRRKVCEKNSVFCCVLAVEMLQDGKPTLIYAIVCKKPEENFAKENFMGHYCCKDVETVEVNPIIFRKLTREDWLHIVDVCDKSLEKYYMRFKK